ncbi:MAG: hypothetical protein IJK97_07290 [Thermoguttaceae bacterium]|nr:hypothetical protein [Thermoguttaceae bacterium]MBR0192246.1 hypothetical protein [Thermoguttaceae bacterium]
MKKTLLLFVLAVFCFAGTVPARQKLYVQPQNVEQLKKQVISDPACDVIWTVWHAELVDWEALRPENYDEIYARLTEEFFLSQFSLKRGFRLEPFFPFLFPKTPEALLEAAPEIQEKITEVKLAVNQTLHEIHTEYFLLPLLLWCRENQVPLEYEMRTDEPIPVAFLIQDAQVVRQISAKKAGFAEALANSVAQQNGKLTLEDRPVVYSKEGTVLLIHDSANCGEVKKIPGGLDYLAEFQIPYTTVKLGKNGPEAGFGAASWKTVQLMSPREKYSPESQKFLKRFEEFGGKVVN